MQGRAQRLARPATPLAARVQRISCQLHFLPYATAIYLMSPELNSVHKTNKNWLPRQRPLRDRKTNFIVIV